MIKEETTFVIIQVVLHDNKLVDYTNAEILKLNG